MITNMARFSAALVAVVLRLVSVAAWALFMSYGGVPPVGPPPGGIVSVVQAAQTEMPGVSRGREIPTTPELFARKPQLAHHKCSVPPACRVRLAVPLCLVVREQSAPSPPE